jgi:hypothetical protein
VKPKRQTKKERRIAINRANAARKRDRRAFAFGGEFMKNPCFAALFDIATAPHGPKCLCIMTKVGMLLIQQFTGKLPGPSRLAKKDRPIAVSNLVM